MKAAKTFSQVTLDATGSNNDYPRGYQVFVSNDGTTWGSAVASGSGSGATVTITMAGQTARYIKIALTASASNWWSIHELNVFAPQIDLAALPRSGWKATASSSTSADLPAYALDGNATTRWSTGVNQVSSGQFFQLDMLSPQLIGQVVLDTTGSPDDYPRGYQVFASNDGTTWGSAIASGSGTAAVVTITFPLQVARYLKIAQMGSVSRWWSIHELNVFGPGPPKLSRSGWIATASLVCQTDVPSKVLDGNISTRWSSGVPQADNNQWFQVDMRTPQTISQIVLDADGSSSDFPRSYRLFVSDDGTNFTGPVATGTGTGQVVTIVLPARTTRYFKIFQVGSSTSWWSIHELNVFGASPYEGCASLAVPGADLPTNQDVLVEATLTRTSSGVSSPPASQTFASPLLFTLPQTMPVSRGNLGNQSVTMALTTPSGSIQCTYKGLSPVASPSAPADVAAGRLAGFFGCANACPLVGGSLFVTDITLTVGGADPNESVTTVTLNVPAANGATVAVTPLANDDPQFKAQGLSTPQADPGAVSEKIKPPKITVHPTMQMDTDFTPNPAESYPVDVVDPDVVVEE